jgi:hypothetical protein
MNWANIESQVKKLAIKNDTSIWMTKFSNANVHFPPQEITNCIGVEPYNINTEYVITPHIGMSTILDSNNIDAQDQFLPTHEFHSLLQKMNIEYLKYLMMLCLRKNIMQTNHFTRSLLEVLVQVKLSYQCLQFKVYYVFTTNILN